MGLNEPFAFNLKHYLNLIDILTHLITEADEKIEKTVTETEHPQAKLLTTIPGISYCSGLTIMAEIGDINRFPSTKKLQGYVGLAPSVYASGDRMSQAELPSKAING